MANRMVVVPRVLLLLLAVGFFAIRGCDCKRSNTKSPPQPAPPGKNYIEYKYSSVSCRSKTASITDFGGVGNGKELNTKAFQNAVDSLSRAKGGGQLIVPAGRWLTGSFRLASHFTLFLDKDAVLLASQDDKEWPLIEALPSYGTGRDTKAKQRYISLIFGTNLTDVVITGNNGTIDGQGGFWWKLFKHGDLKYTRPYLLELMYSEKIVISNLTFVNSPSWNIHPVYSSDITVQGITISAPTTSPNTDGINPDSCTNVRIIDCYIVSGDDCVAVKSGWDEYGIKVNMSTKQVWIKGLHCISPTSAAIALGSEMSGGIEEVFAEDVVAVDTESGHRIKTANGRGGYVRNIYSRKFTLHTIKRLVIWMTGDYKSHPDKGFNASALPSINNINYRDFTVDNAKASGVLEGMENNPFTDICIANVTIGLEKTKKKSSWTCSKITGTFSSVTPEPCDLLSNQGPDHISDCDFPKDKDPPLKMPKLKMCTIRLSSQ